MMEDLWKKTILMKTTLETQVMKKVPPIWSILICLDRMVGGEEIMKEMIVHKAIHYTLQTAIMSP